MSKIKKIFEKIKEFWDVSKYYSSATIECTFCPYYTRCTAEIESPEDNPDGTCKQKDIYIATKEE